MRAILYARVSTADQNVDMQIAAMRDYCASRQWSVVDTVSETESGKKNDRPKRAEIIKRSRSARGPGFDVLLVWKLDRWGRSTGDLLTTIDELSNASISFVSVTEGFDLSTPAGRMVLGMLAVLASFERELIVERVRAGIARYRQKNQKWGRPAKTKKKAAMVVEMYRSGMTYKQIAAATGMVIASVYRILKSEGELNGGKKANRNGPGEPD
jgi:DNA invertase Pin-like site-specific DNA recombinase